jgi:streptogramin lyase
MYSRRGLMLAVVVAVAVLGGSLALAGASASANPVTEFSTGITEGSGPQGIAAGPDGNLWFTEPSGGRSRIGRITPTGTATQFSEGITESLPVGIAAGPDGNLWFTAPGDFGVPARIGRITPTGAVTEFSEGINPNVFSEGIAAGPDGNLWFTGAGIGFTGAGIGQITPTGTVTQFSTGITSQPSGIAAGPDGNLWFTEPGGNRIGKITPTGTVTEFSKGIAEGSGPYGIAAGKDGNLWFTEVSRGIGRITPTGTVTEFSAGITAGSEPRGIAAGPDGNLWFTEFSGNRIGRITPAGVVTEFSAGITEGSGPFGIAAGPDGNLWFTEFSGNRIGRIGTVALPKFLLTVADTGAGTGTVTGTRIGEPSGIKCVSALPLRECTEELEERTKVKLTAAPAGGSKFVKWSGGPCEGSEAPTCEFEMPGKATEVKAEFVEAPLVWLCQPGAANDPCESDLTTTVQLPNGSSFVRHFKSAKNPPIDCIYVYPTVSSQNTLNANLEVEPEETQIAIDQASRFSQVCKVYALTYPQVTIPGILGFGGLKVTPAAEAIAYSTAVRGWRAYLATYNHGRGFVLIGHSQGAIGLRKLIKEQIDPNPALRHRLVSADLLGGQVTVPVGKDVGGDFQHVPACHAAWQTGCVVAYSSFLKEPPEPSNFGRVASPLLKTEPNSSLQILCVNPAALFPGDQSGHSEGDQSGPSQGNQSGGSQGDQSGLLLPYESTSPFPGLLGFVWQVPEQVPTARTPWVSTPGQYSAQCKHANDASWLQLTETPFTGPLRDAVQKLTVSGTSGEIGVVAPEGRGFAVFGFNATHEEVQTALEEPEGTYDEGRVRVLFGSMFGKGNVQVTGGPGDEKGTKPYVITFIGSLAHQAVPLLGSFPLFGSREATATVVEVTLGGDPRLQIAETNGPLWGTHLVDVNIALGNLVGLTAVQARAYQAHRHDGHSG